MSTMRQGVFHRWRVHFFGERDTVARQLSDIARQGAGMARLAHASSFLLLLLFSLGSLVALGGDALNHVITGYAGGHLDVPAAISLAVSGLLVTAMDVAALYAALVIRLLGVRRAERREYALHAFVLVVACLLESATYIYMALLYEHPADPAAWTLVIARAVAAPLFSVYLSLARPLPVTSRDILAQVELASGQGLIRNAVTIANDPAADMGEKVALFAASAIMSHDDRKRLDGLMRAIEMRGIPVYVGTVSSPQLPTGPGTPIAASVAPSGPAMDEPQSGPPTDRRLELVRPAPRRHAPASRRKRARSGVRTVDSYEGAARAAWASGARSVAKMRAAVPGMSQSAAGGWVRALRTEEQGKMAQQVAL